MLYKRKTVSIRLFSIFLILFILLISFSPGVEAHKSWDDVLDGNLESGFYYVGWYEDGAPKFVKNNGYPFIYRSAGLKGSSRGLTSSVCESFETPALGQDDLENECWKHQEYVVHVDTVEDYFDYDSSDLEDFFFNENQLPTFSNIKTEGFLLADKNSNSEAVLRGFYITIDESEVSEEDGVRSVSTQPIVTLTQQKDNFYTESRLSDGFLSIYVCNLSQAFNSPSLSCASENIYTLQSSFGSLKMSGSSTNGLGDYSEVLPSFDLELRPGAYFVAIAAEFQADSHNNKHTAGYFKTNFLDLKPERSLSSSLAQHSPAICEDFGYEWLDADKRTSGVDYDEDKLCCGYNYGGGSEFTNGDIVCADKNWQTPEDLCDVEGVDDSSLCFQESVVNHSADDISSISDGSDGCCGDDQLIYSDAFKIPKFSFFLPFANQLCTNETFIDEFIEAHDQNRLDYFIEDYSLPDNMRLDELYRLTNNLRVPFCEQYTFCELTYDVTSFSFSKCMALEESANLDNLFSGNFLPIFNEVIPRLVFNDLAYVSGGENVPGRYFCNQDSLTGDDSNNMNIWSSVNTNDPFWRWWDARSSLSMYLAHQVQLGVALDSSIGINNTVDFISNGDEWFYCDATGFSDMTSSHATPIKEGENFSSPSGVEGFACVSILNQISYLFEEGGACYGDLDALELESFGPFEPVDSDKNQLFYCGDDNPQATSTETNPYFNYASDLEDACYQNCYASTTPLDSILNEDELSLECFNNLSQELCTALYGANNLDACLLGNTLTSSDSEDQIVEKESCGFDLSGCLTPAPSYQQNCSDIEVTRNGVDYVGRTCGQNSYCLSGEYALSGDLSNPDNEDDIQTPAMCCLVQDNGLETPQPLHNNPLVCGAFEEDDMNLATCENMGGSYLSTESNLNNYQCEPSPFMVVGQRCCIGSWVPNWETLAYSTLSQPEAFVCYEHNGDARISECCTDYTVCNARQEQSISLGETYNKNNFLYYGKGGTLHTLENYDGFGGSPDLLRDYVKIVSFEQSEIKELSISRTPSKLVYKAQSRVGDFDYLEFDIAYNQKLFSKRTNLSLKLATLQGGVKECQLSKPLDAYLMNGNASMRWHHAVIPLNDTNCTINPSWRFTDVVFEKEKQGGMAVVDNFFLSENPQERVNTENYYCTGNFGSWISNLDGATDKGFTNEFGSTTQDDYVETVGEYWYACEAQASFDWTGTKCCGDDTRASYAQSSLNDGEYFADITSGCYHGTPVALGKTVGYALNKPGSQLDNILFWNGSFLPCVALDSRVQRNISYNGTYITNSKLIKEGDAVEPMTPRGDYVCMADGLWHPKEDVPQAALLASKLYNFTFNENGEQIDEYSLACESAQQITPYKGIAQAHPLTYRQAGLDTILEQDMIADVCAISYYEDNEPRHILGIAVNYSFDVQDILRDLGSHFNNAVVFDESQPTLSQDFSKACLNLDFSQTTEDQFYQACETTHGWSLAYNKDFQLLLVAQEPDNPAQDYQGLFAQDGVGEFINTIYDYFRDLFRGWFINQDTLFPNGEPQYQTTTISPLTSLNTTSFSQLYIARRGDKHVQGVVTTPQNPLANASHYITIKYINVTTPASQLSENYHDTGVTQLALNYITGEGNQQVISLAQDVHDPDQHLRGINALEVKKYFEPAFDWRRLTFALDINKSVVDAVDAYPTVFGDGALQLGELCDNNDTSVTSDDVFRYQDNSCARWTGQDIEGTVECLSDGTINTAPCFSTSGSTQSYTGASNKTQ